MTVNQAKQLGYTHHGKIYGWKCYLKHDDEGGTDVIGINWFCDAMIEAFTYLDITIFPDKEGFYILQGEPL